MGGQRKTTKEEAVKLLARVSAASGRQTRSDASSPRSSRSTSTFPSSEQLLAEVDDFLARLLSPYAMIWNPILRRKIKRLRKRIADV